MADIDLGQARLLVGGEWSDGVDTCEVRDKFNGRRIGTSHTASEAQVVEAVGSARRSFETTPLTPSQRFRILTDAAQLVLRDKERLARTIVAEAGFPYIDAENEVARTAQTFVVAAEEGKRLSGEMVPIDSAAGHEHRMAFTVRVPRGVVCGITAFNSPLNMVAHKVAPALASGNTIVVKAPDVAPFSATLLAGLLLEAGLPRNHLQLVQGPGAQLGPWLTADPRISFYSFTGSTKVGRQIRDAIGLRPIALELGSIAATIVCDDADLDRAATRCVQSAFRRAGQACTSVQRLFVHRSVWDAFVPKLVTAAQALQVGDPHDRATVVGPLISERDAMRVESWVGEAVAQGARLLTGGRRTGSVFAPTILTEVSPRMRVMCEEVFGPVVSLVPFDDVDAVIGEVNATPFGLACGVFTLNVMRALDMARRIHVGVVHINEPSSSRVDLMPFAGVKESGLGTEGPRYAMREMTEERLITISLK